MADNTLLDFFWHNKINATAKEEFTCLKSTDKQSSSAQMFQQGKKETTKKFQLEILATNFATQVQQKSRMPTENDVRGSVTFKEKVIFFLY